MSWRTIVLIGALLIVLILFVPTQWSRRNGDRPADRRRMNNVDRDDDRHWSGFIYNNPDDPNVLVPKRYGWGWTINFGHPMGKLFLIGILLLAVVPALLGIFFPGSITSHGCHPSGCHLFP
ncbi:MAG TPA: DUF5808 domain-containing protein [Chloroflexota bacterium]|nr:DUF5808 domain-containing protein [Chloroflexota bacterium]